MDANKLDKLRAIGYTIKPSCALCKHSSFPNNDWGTCSKYQYDHLKHNGTHNLSIHKLGSCNQFVIDDSKIQDMRHYKEFMPR